ncbi:hypothetical protein H2200_005437 [Cladophialophora chaetospira]|uniref:CBF1-interacting co-repressor CIR N-terminal domain-containing protein n=1 Tax=Cladophialophora chaetospira TaxID=386627 RepID=A0AA38XBZ5_9EURO|nr:hypothetical protein H2200_005437 [Cladophialophora chaetospira]
MPLHLLQKKSWNVYAPANIERVKRDEAEARRQAVDQEKRSLQNEANDRIELLRQQSSKDRKALKRKLPGEDDTQRDIRLAVESASVPTTKRKEDHGSVFDADGHIALITPPQKKPRVDQVQEKDPYTVYLTDATGRDQKSKDTWYTSLHPQPGRWGDDNPRKQQRQLASMSAIDPLAAIKKGVKSLRENERARKEWMAQRERDLHEVERLARKDRHERKRKRRRDHSDDDLDSIDGFNLDEGYVQSKEPSQPVDAAKHRKRSHRHHHRHSRHREDQNQEHRHHTRDEPRSHKHTQRAIDGDLKESRREQPV